MNIVRSDWIELRSTVLKQYYRRYVELDTDDRLSFYYPDPKKPTEKGELNSTILCGEIVSISEPTPNSFMIHLVTTPENRNFRMKCFTEKRARDWKKDLGRNTIIS
eukprot:Pgem_evm3s6434